MLFISPMLATRPEDARRIASPHFIAELELDGQRAQLHVGEAIRRGVMPEHRVPPEKERHPGLEGRQLFSQRRRVRDRPRRLEGRDPAVRDRKGKMVDGLIAAHLEKPCATRS
jgi:hypothetical protein